ncbi:hypothetical protein [Rhodococcus sovatensis]|uniref:Uncharacterized protein n=1 Tax=Rhodococcus sovatensis TaxID=1805840 RepID=A0ABZ2PPG9_9NOCA
MSSPKETYEISQGQDTAGVLAFSFVLPYAVPLSTEPVHIHVGQEYLRIRGVESADHDLSWMLNEFTCFL